MPPGALVYRSCVSDGPNTSSDGPVPRPRGGAEGEVDAALEAALAEIRRTALMLEHDLPAAVDLGRSARALERAWAGLLDAADGRGDPLVGTRIAISEVDAASTALGRAIGEDPGFDVAVEHLRRARAHLAVAEDRLARTPASPSLAVPELLASIDQPRLHVVARESLAPALVVPLPPPPAPAAPAQAPIATPASFAELRSAIAELKKRALTPGAPPMIAARVPAPPRAAAVKGAEPPPGFAADIEEAMDEATFVRMRARDAFEEIAMVGMQRAPLPGDHWRTSLSLERRMLAAIDLIAALGPVAIAHVPRLVADAPAKDPSRAFAIAMVLGTIAGRDALAAAEHALLSNARDAAFTARFGEGLVLVPHDRLAVALRTLLSEPEPAVRAMAIDVLGYRGLATADELVAAASDVPVVAARAFRRLASSPVPELEALALAWDETDDDDLRGSVLTAVAAAGSPRAQQMLASALSSPSADTAALLLALTGDERDAELLRARARGSPSAGLATALGWGGAVTAVGDLIDLLDDDDPGVQLAAGIALERITGAGLWEEVLVESEEIEVADPPEPDVGERAPMKLSRAVSDPRDLPPDPARERVERPSTDPARWRAYWLERGPSLPAGMRLRRGRPYTPLVSVAELDTGPVTLEERRLLQLELVVRTGAIVRFDPHDFVVVQERAIERWRAVAEGASSAPGRWVRPLRKGA